MASCLPACWGCPRLWRREGPSLSPERRARGASQSGREASGPHIAEWFGHRVFPVVSCGDTPIHDQRSGRCPFLTETLKHSTPCVKAPNSRGVCTISASSNGPRQDWLVCPYRALDDSLLTGMIRRLYGLAGQVPVFIRPARALADPVIRQKVLDAFGGKGPWRRF